jgi:hypothetical protein
MHRLSEQARRKPGASGIPVTLSDGAKWLFASPVFKASQAALTSPNIDKLLDRIFEKLVLEKSVPLVEVMSAAGLLLKANYHLADEELSDLLEADIGGESNQLVEAILEVLFGPAQAPRSYSHWIRASLLSNGLGATTIDARELPHVLALLVSTGRSIPLSGFADACTAAVENERLEALV